MQLLDLVAKGDIFSFSNRKQLPLLTDRKRHRLLWLQTVFVLFQSDLIYVPSDPGIHHKITTIKFHAKVGYLNYTQILIFQLDQ